VRGQRRPKRSRALNVLRTTTGSHLPRLDRGWDATYRRRMSLVAAGLVPLLSVTAASAVPSQNYMPFALILVPIVLAGLLLLVFGRQRRKSRHDHEE
jgi:hypothetical protein